MATKESVLVPIPIVFMFTLTEYSNKYLLFFYYDKFPFVRATDSQSKYILPLIW